MLKDVPGDRGCGHITGPPVLTMSQAVERYVQPGGELFIGGFGYSEPFAFTHEIIRQGVNSLRVLKASGSIVLDQLVGAGLVEEVVVCHAWNSVGPTPAYAMRRAVEAGIPHPIRLQDLSFGVFSMGLWAAAHGLPFAPVGSMRGSGQWEVRPWEHVPLRESVCPFTGELTAVVPPIRPRLGVFHVLHVDRHGNGQLRGPVAEARLAAAACERVILCAERLVEPEVIRERPETTLIPGIEVDAVVIEPWGAHPGDCLGAYGRDLDHMLAYGWQTRDIDGLVAYLDQWVRGVSGRAEYMDRLPAANRERLAVGVG